VWLFFDQAFLSCCQATLSTLLLEPKVSVGRVDKPVDKSVVKLWKDSVERRNYWLGAIVGLAAW
jgi:hypothetical protein